MVLAGVEPPIEIDGRRHAAEDRRRVSARWLVGTVLTGSAGAALMAATLYVACERRGTVAQPPEYALAPRRAADDSAGPTRGDRLLRKADIVAERQTFKAPSTVTVGDKQVIRLHGYTHVSTTLTLAPTDLADKVPLFNPLKLLGGDDPGPADTAPDPGPVLDPSEVAFVTSELGAVDPARFGAELSKADVAAQVAEQVRATAQVGARATLALPPQFLLMRATRPSLDAAAGLLGYATSGAAGAVPFSSISVRMTPENVTVMPRSEAAHDAGATEDRLVVLRHGDTLEDTLREAGAPRTAARAVADVLEGRRGGTPVAEGRRLRLTFGPPDAPSATPVLARLTVYADETPEAVVALADDGRYLRVDASAPAGGRRNPSGDDDEEGGGLRLYDSLYQTALKQQVPAAVIGALIKVLANDVDFQQAVQGGDSLDVFYTDDDDADGKQDLLFASVTIRNEVFRYYRFAAPDGSAPEYFDDGGRSMRKFLIRTPVTAGVFTSGFGMRFHPILGYSRPHTGVDWSAPVGTPILAAGNGTVLKAERSSGYGNHVEIQHANGYVTTYSHMIGFARGVAEGARIRQGQVVGYLGATGLATGPHLHYEVIVNGRFVDPMRVKLARSRDVTGPQLSEFKKEHDRIETLMSSAPNAPRDGLQKRASTN